MLKDVSQEAAERGKGYSEKLVAKAVERGRSTQEDGDALLARITADRRPGGGRGRRARDRGGVRGPVGQARGVRRDRAASGRRTRCSAPTPRRCRSPGWPRTSRAPADFIGLHFFSPVDKMPLLEIIRGEQTSDETLYRALDVAKQMKQDADRRQRQPRLLHQPRDRHVHQRGDRDAGRGHPRGDDRAGLLQAGLPGAGAAALRRAQHEADAQDPQRRQRRGRGRRRRPGTAIRPRR